MSSDLPKGIVTPLVTFIDSEGAVDRTAIKALVDFQIVNGVAGLIAVGSTGELGQLTPEQRVAVVEDVVAAADARVPVWAGVGELGTATAVRSAKRLQDAGADALLLMPPLFFDVSDDELATHFRSVAAAVSIPIIAYDVPPRTPRKLPAALVAELAAEGVLSGIKDSSGDLDQARSLFQRTGQIPGFRSYAGAEVTMDAALDAGFDGLVPGLANVAPRLASHLFAAHVRGDMDTRTRLQGELIDLFDIVNQGLPSASFSAQAIGALKVAAASRIDVDTHVMTPPFAAITESFVAAVHEVTARCLEDDVRTEAPLEGSPAR